MESSSTTQETVFPVSIHFGIPILCEGNTDTPFQDAVGSPTVTLKVDRISSGIRNSHYFLAYVKRTSDSLCFDHYAETSHGGNAVRFYGNREFYDFEVKSENFCETVEFFHQKEDFRRGDSLRFVIAYMALIAHFDIVAHPAFNNEQRDFLFSMRQVIADAYNCCQVNRSEWGNGIPCNLQQGYVMTNNSPKTIDDANVALREMFRRFSPNELTNINKFTGNVVSTSQFGTVYSYHKGMEFLPACYSQCIYRHDKWHDKLSGKNNANFHTHSSVSFPSKVLIDGDFMNTIKMESSCDGGWAVIGFKTFNGNTYYGIDDRGTVKWINKSHCVAMASDG